MLVLADIICKIWSEWRGNLRSSQMYFGIAMTLDPESSIPRIEPAILGTLALRVWRGRRWWVTMSLSSFLIIWLPYSHVTTEGSWPESLLTCTTWEEGLVITHLAVMSSQSCFLNSSVTMSKSSTDTGTLEPSTWSRTCQGTISSSKGNKYQYYAEETSDLLVGGT